MKTETTIRTDLIRQLANHLLHGKLAHKKFDFKVFNTDDEAGDQCGTAGCMLGEAPAVWPNKWEWDGGFVLLKKNSSESTCNDACEFFGISLKQYRHLFMPNGQNPVWGEILPRNATKKAVATNALKFCDMVENWEME